MDTLRWTTQDLELMPEDGNRYEIVDGELYVSKQPDLQHQMVCTKIASLLDQWNTKTQLGVSISTPGVIFTNDNAVVPDVVWISYKRLATAFQADRKLHSSPELMIEVLSPGSSNEQRDREVKLKLYSRRGTQEYWIVNWPERSVEVYQRENAALTLSRTLNENDIIETPLLPEFRCKVGQFFTTINTL